MRVVTQVQAQQPSQNVTNIVDLTNGDIQVSSPSYMVSHSALLPQWPSMQQPVG
eukprot:CAMPEP_0170641410 /NCGR_PEP_ID=MMETSP0224-20130122/40747_1 /TAXON_ID=285029 /ORGANISM="Togula jolla, Strain CCCM 725" /LENGTH=53 /DNA_ID=CAMNT_0010971989 /DNA_START=91 /DNA_END=252 /DNA_ORIENTATION=-